MQQTTDTFEHVLQDLLLSLEQQIDDFGWDQPPTLWEFLAADDIAEVHGDALPVDADGVSPSFGLRRAQVITGEDPYEALVGSKADENALGAMLVCEAWAAPAGDRSGVAPTDHPDRREVRILDLVLRDGTALSVVRYRDKDEPETGDGDAQGRLPSALRRYLDMDSGISVSEDAASVGTRAWAAALSFSGLSFVTEMLAESDAADGWSGSADDLFPSLPDGHVTELNELMSELLTWAPRQVLASFGDDVAPLQAAVAFDSVAELAAARTDRTHHAEWDEVCKTGAGFGNVFCEWADAGMAFCEFSVLVPELDQILGWLRDLERFGLDVATVNTIRDIVTT